MSGLHTAFELPLDGQYVADCVGLGFLSIDEFRARGIGVDTLKFYIALGGEVEDLIGFRYPEQHFVYVIEAKARRADYLSTFGPNGDPERLEPRGNLHWIVANRRITEQAEVPDPWGLLIPRGGGLTEYKRAIYCEIPLEQVYRVGYLMLWKRHVGRHEWALKLMAHLDWSENRWEQFYRWLYQANVPLREVLDGLMSGAIPLGRLSSDKIGRKISEVL